MVVKSILATNDAELEDKLNELEEEYDIKVVMFIGNNPMMKRIYQVVLRRK